MRVVKTELDASAEVTALANSMFYYPGQDGLN